jgi:hypothetical protein
MQREHSRDSHLYVVYLAQRTEAKPTWPSRCHFEYNKVVEENDDKSKENDTRSYMRIRDELDLGGLAGLTRLSGLSGLGGLEGLGNVRRIGREEGDQFLQSGRQLVVDRKPARLSACLVPDEPGVSPSASPGGSHTRDFTEKQQRTVHWSSPSPL